MMNYGQLITRSFSIMWGHRYLWILAILGGADVGGGGLNPFNVGRIPGGVPGTPQPKAGQQLGQFMTDNLGAIVAVAALALILALAWFLLTCVTTGALVRASAEHDAERPFRFGLAWRAGLSTFWQILVLRLLGFLWFVLVAASILGLVLLGYVTYAAGRSSALAVIIVVGVLAVVALIVASIIVGIAFILATRSVVLELRGPIAALGRAFRLLAQRLGRTLLVWLIQVGLGFAAGLALAIPIIFGFVIAAVMIGSLAAASGPGAAALLAIPFGLVFLAGVLVLGGITGAYFTTFWTLAFRRMELDAPPPVAYWAQPGYPPTVTG